MKTVNDMIFWLSKRRISAEPFGFERMEFLMERLGKPHLDVPGVIIGGTNGKGSVTAILEAILASTDDYQVGATTSPHLVSALERVRVQRKVLSAAIWLEGFTELKKISNLMDKEDSIGAPSFFELVTAFAFWAFRDLCDISLLEVGLGGRLDATNIKYPEISVITNIGTDHQEQLGTDRFSIAQEKLGIVKKKGVLITSEEDSRIIELFQKTCADRKVEMIQVEAESAFSEINSHSRGHKIALKNGRRVDFPLPGSHQVANLAVALAVVERLQKNGFVISDEAVTRGISSVVWPGRLQWLDGDPPILLDGAHNEEGMKSLLNYLDKFPLPGPKTLVFGAMLNKPVEKMAIELGKRFDNLVFVPTLTVRPFTEDDFEGRIKPLDSRWHWQASLAVALEEAKKAKSVLITGSLYLIAQFFSETGTRV